MIEIIVRSGIEQNDGFVGWNAEQQQHGLTQGDCNHVFNKLEVPFSCTIKVRQQPKDNPFKETGQLKN